MLRLETYLNNLKKIETFIELRLKERVLKRKGLRKRKRNIPKIK